MDIKKSSILILILSLALVLRIWGISSESYWLDETIAIKQSQSNYQTTLEMVKEDVHMPLYVTVLHVWIKIFGISEIAARSLSMIFGILSILIIYLLAKKMFSAKTAIIASLLASISPIMIYYSQETKLYALFVFLTISSYYFFLKYLEKNDYKSMIPYILFTSLLMYTHIFSFLIILTQNIYAIYYNKVKIKMWLISQVILVLLFLPWLPNLVYQITNRSLGTMWIPTPSIKILVFTLYDFFSNYLAALMFIICIITFILTKKYKTIDKNSLILLIFWIIIPFILVVVYSSVFSSLFMTRYLLFTLPPILILLAVMIPKQKWFSGLIIFVLIFTSSTAVYDQAIRMDKHDWRGVSTYIQENVKEEAIFIDPFYHQQPFTYYYDVDCFKEDDMLSCNANKNKIFSLDWKAECCNDKTILSSNYNSLNLYLDQDIWLISVRPELYETNGTLYDYFYRHKNITTTKSFGEIKIYKFE